jgi:hypothetical protein
MVKYNINIDMLSAHNPGKNINPSIISVSKNQNFHIKMDNAIDKNN